MTISGALVAEIVRLYTVEGWRIGTIARHLGVHHSTVRRALDESNEKPEKGRRPSMVDPYRPFIKETFSLYPRLSASVLYRMVRARGYPGGEDHFRHLVATMRPRKPAEAFLELRTFPGEQAQVDWGSFGRRQVMGGERALSAFVMVLSYSRQLHVRFFFDQRMGSFLEGHARAFDFFGGVAKTLLYDNLKSAVLERVDDAIRFHPRLLELAAHYHFQPKPVAVGRGNEKGRVEPAIRYLRTPFLPGLVFSSLDDLSRQADRFCSGIAPRRQWPQEKRLTVADAYAKEKPLLVPLPNDRFPAAEIVEATVGKTPYVRFDSNRYSVPHDRVRRQVTVRASSTSVRIFDTGELVAEHRRCHAKHQVVEETSHVANLVEEKRKARRHRAQERLLSSVPRAEALLTEIAARQRHLAPAVTSLTLLLDRFGRVEMAVAVDEALAKGSPSVETVQLILDRRRRARNEPPSVALELPDRPEIRDIAVTPHNLADYDMGADDDDCVGSVHEQ
jgi:transposase